MMDIRFGGTDDNLSMSLHAQTPCEEMALRLMFGKPQYDGKPIMFIAREGPNGTGLAHVTLFHKEEEE